VRRSVFFTVVAFATLSASLGTASAQSVGVYVGPAYDDYFYYDGPPRTYGYTRYDDGVAVRRYRRPLRNVSLLGRRSVRGRALEVTHRSYSLDPVRQTR
jgi:hypothetical protein